MAVHRIPRWQKAGALVPMGMVVSAWGIALTGSGFTTAVDADAGAVPSVPATALEQPASVQPITSKHGAALDGLSAAGIPAPAMTAYYRAATLLGQADPGCHLPWNLVAAIGRVESDHGRAGGSSLNATGVATPPIIGVALSGESTARVNDTDGGALDGDAVFDHAVGPMQFIPATWQHVALDADGDGKANPQDIDDAATGSGVYLCSGEGNLRSARDARAAVLRYNHSTLYADLVLAISQAYARGDFTAAHPTGASSLTRTSASAALTAPHTTQRRSTSTAKPAPTPAPAPASSPGPGPAPAPAPAPALAPAQDPLTWLQAQAICLTQGISALDLAKLNACVTELLNP